LSDCNAVLEEAIMMSAAERKESRGANYVAEYPDRMEAYRKTSVASFDGEKVQLRLAEIPSLRAEMKDRLYPANVSGGESL
ncbi:MAG: hypothetical protein IJ100_02560, partial [Lachnospiraceae bacterium]|nr:hypothetical protein [Lachnospiraceae bacterium]